MISRRVPLAGQPPDRVRALGYVYIMRCEGLHKVGWALEPAARVVDLQTGNPFGIELVAAYPAPGISANRIERWVHRLLHASHIRGEWFDASEDAVRAAIVAAFGRYGVPMLSIEEVGRRLAKHYLQAHEDAPAVRKAIARDRVKSLIQIQFDDGTAC